MKRSHTGEPTGPKPISVVPPSPSAELVPTAVPAAVPAVAPSSGTSMANRKLAKEIGRMKRPGMREEACLAFDIIDDADLYVWKARYYPPEPDDKSSEQEKNLHAGCVSHNKEYIEFRLRFPPDYPFSPPFVWNYYPQIEKSCVFSNGGICHQQLSSQQNNGWAPQMSPETLMVGVISTIKTYPKMRIKEGAHHPNLEDGARKDFTRIESAHSNGWPVQPPK